MLTNTNRLIRFLLLITIVIFAFHLYSCSGNNSDTIVKDSDKKTAFVSFEGRSLQAVNQFYINLKISDFPRLSHLMADIDEERSLNIISEIKKKFRGDIDHLSGVPKFIVFFSKKSYSNVQLDEIDGMSLFIKNADNSLNHHFYKVIGNGLAEDKSLAVKTDYFEIPEINLISAIAFNDENEKWTMFKSVSQSDQVRSGLTRKVNPINYLGKLLVSKYPKINSALLVEGCTDCGGGGGNCTGDSEGAHCCETCAPPVCEEDQVNEASGDNSGRIASGTGKLNTDEAYYFRDNFMAKYKKGREYIAYYYKISQISYENKMITKENVGTFLSFALKIHEAAKKLQDETSNEIIIDAALKEDAFDMIKRHQIVSNDQEFQQILSIIKGDVERFSGKTRKEILGQIN